MAAVAVCDDLALCRRVVARNGDRDYCQPYDYRYCYHATPQPDVDLQLHADGWAIAGI